jgi:hypothetical protein
VIALMNHAGLTVERGIRGGLRGPLTRVADTVTAGLLRDHLTRQYVVAGKPTTGRAEQGAVQWLFS